MLLGGVGQGVNVSRAASYFPVNLSTRALATRGSVCWAASAFACSSFRVAQARWASFGQWKYPICSCFRVNGLQHLAANLRDGLCQQTPIGYFPRKAPHSSRNLLISDGRNKHVPAEYTLFPGTNRSLSNWLPSQGCFSIQYLNTENVSHAVSTEHTPYVGR